MFDLTELHINRNQVSDLSPLAGLTGLTLLGLWGNQISDIFPLLGLTSLGGLYLRDNPLNSEACSVYIPQIRNNPDIVIYYDPCPGPPVVVTWWAQHGDCGSVWLWGFLVSSGDSSCEVRFGLQQCLPIFPYRCLEPIYTVWGTMTPHDFRTRVDVNPGEDYTFWAEWRNATGSGRGEKLSFTTPPGVKVPALAN